MLGIDRTTKPSSKIEFYKNPDIFINQATGTESSYNVFIEKNTMHKRNKRKIQNTKNSKKDKKEKNCSFDDGDNSDGTSTDGEKVYSPMSINNYNNTSGCEDYYNSYNWVDNLDDFYTKTDNITFIDQANFNGTHDFFESTNEDSVNEDNNRMQNSIIDSNELLDKDYCPSDSSDGDGDSSEDDTDDTDGDENDENDEDNKNGQDTNDEFEEDTDDEKPNKKKIKKTVLEEEINDLKKDIINNSDPSDHYIMALESLKEMREEFPKIKVFELMTKFKKEIINLNKLKSTPGIKLTNNLYVKYISAFNKVHDMLKKEYNKKKEKLNVKMWIRSEINKNKKTPKKTSKTFKNNNEDLLYSMLFGQSFPSTLILPASSWSGISQPVKDQELINEFNTLYKQDSTEKSGTDYFAQLNTSDKKEYIKKLKDIKKIDGFTDNKPNMAKIIECNTTDNNKSIILSKINNFENLKGSSEYYKLKNWINKIMKIPFGKYISAPVTKSDGSEKIREYLQKVRKNLDEDIYGHDVTKQQLIKILAHTIANPGEGGNVFALQGPPGIGKTALIQDGISKALGRPFTFISLGGATDACFLEGHDYTYEGSNCGRIVDLLRQAGCMNPVIYFDELDKVSETPKGEEIINILMHITDVTQNSHFNDKYFGGIDFDLSKAIIIFSFNDEHKISRILRDRMKIIRIKGYKMTDKINIARDYLLPKLMKQIGLDIEVIFKDDIIEYITDSFTDEGGVRKLKEILNDILLEINLRKLEDNTILGKKIKNKLTITKNMLDQDLLKKKHKIEHIHINPVPYIGQVNGLWANDYGVGGLIPIECCWIPSADKLKLELTGRQGKVMKESMSVARTIAWKILPVHIKDKLNEKWSKSFDNGIHVHCPDGATPKDGPSAGGAITTCLISLLSGIPVNNKIAMTGEINLKGQITKIGGLEEKIFGAKKAGAQIVLCPEENTKDLDEIKEKFPNLFDEKFFVKTVKNIWEILDQVLITKLDYQKF
jgi:endopeptidase La